LCTEQVMHPILETVFISVGIELKNLSLTTGQDPETIYSCSHPSMENEYAINKACDILCNVFSEHLCSLYTLKRV
jgi:hypothetical protein